MATKKNSSENAPKNKDSKVIEYSTLPKKKSAELNNLLDEIVETLNGMGEEIKKKAS